jgi:hypothetical protein
LFIVCQKERLDALEAVSDDPAHVGGGIGRVGADHGSDADVEQIPHGAPFT